MTHTSPDGWSVKTTIPVQQINGHYKNYTIIYVVFEKVYACNYYPPNNEVTFYGIFSSLVISPLSFPPFPSRLQRMWSGKL